MTQEGDEQDPWIAFNAWTLRHPWLYAAAGAALGLGYVHGLTDDLAVTLAVVTGLAVLSGWNLRAGPGRATTRRIIERRIGRGRPGLVALAALALLTTYGVVQPLVELLGD